MASAEPRKFDSVEKRLIYLGLLASPLFDCAAKRVRAGLAAALMTSVHLGSEALELRERLFGWKDGIVQGAPVFAKRTALLGWLDVEAGALVFFTPAQERLRVRTCARAQVDPAAVGGILLVTSWCLERPREGSMVELVIYSATAVATRVTRALHAVMAVGAQAEGGGAAAGSSAGRSAGGGASGGSAHVVDASSTCEVCCRARAELASCGSRTAGKLERELGTCFIVRGVVAAIGPLVKIDLKTSTSPVGSVTPCLLHDVDFGGGDGGGRGLGERAGASSPRVAAPAASPTLVLIYGSPRINAAASLLVPGRVCTFFLANPFSIKQRDAACNIALLCCENSERFGDAFPDDSLWSTRKAFFSCDATDAIAFPATTLAAALKSVVTAALVPASPAPVAVAALRGRVLVASRRLLLLTRVGADGGSVTSAAAVNVTRPIAVWWGRCAPRPIAVTLPRPGSIVDVYGMCEVLESTESCVHVRADARTSWTVLDDAHTFESLSAPPASSSALTPPPAQPSVPAPAAPRARARMSPEYVAKFLNLGRALEAVFCAHPAGDALALRTATSRVCQSFYRGAGPRTLILATGVTLDAPEVKSSAGALTGNDMAVYHAFIFSSPSPSPLVRVREMHTPSSLATAAVACADALSRAAAELDAEPLRQPWAAVLADCPGAAAALFRAAEERANRAVVKALENAGLRARSVAARVGRDWVSADLTFRNDAGSTLVARAGFSERSGHWFVSDDVTAFLALAVIGGGALPSSAATGAAAPPVSPNVPFMHCESLTLRVDVVRVMRPDPAATLAMSIDAVPTAPLAPPVPGSLPIPKQSHRDDAEHATTLPAIISAPDAAVAWEVSVAAAALSRNSGTPASAAGGASADAGPDPFTGEHSLGALRGAYEAAGATLGGGGWAPVPVPEGAAGMIFRASLCVSVDDALQLLAPVAQAAPSAASAPALTQTLPPLPSLRAAPVTERSAPRQSLLYMPLATPIFGVSPAAEDAALNPFIEGESSGAVQKITLCGKERSVRGVAIVKNGGEASALDLQFVDGLVPGGFSLAVGRIVRVDYSHAGPGFVSLGDGDAVHSAVDVSDTDVAALRRAAAATLEPERRAANAGPRAAGVARASLTLPPALVPRIVMSVRALHSTVGELFSVEDPCSAFWAPLGEGDAGSSTASFYAGGGAGVGDGDGGGADAYSGVGTRVGAGAGAVSADDVGESSVPRRKPPTFTLVGRVVSVSVEPPDEGRFTSDALKAAAGPDAALVKRAVISHAALAARDSAELDKLDPLPLYRRFVGCGLPDVKLLLTLAHVPLGESDVGARDAASGESSDAPLDTISLYVRCHLESGAGVLPLGFGPGAVVAVDSVRRMIRRNLSCYATTDEGVISLLRGRDDVAALSRAATVALDGAPASYMDRSHRAPELFSAANASAHGSESRAASGAWKFTPNAKVFWEVALKGSRAPLRPLPESVARLIKGRRIKLVHVRAADAERILECAKEAGAAVAGAGASTSRGGGGGGGASSSARGVGVGVGVGGRTLPLLYALPLDVGEPDLPLLGPLRHSVEAVAEGDAAALDAAVAHLREDKISQLTLYVAVDAAWLRVTADGLWCDGTAEVKVKAADAYASAHASTRFPLGAAARLLRLSHRAIGHWGATAARVGCVGTPFGGGGRGAETWLGGGGSSGAAGGGGAGDDEDFSAVTAPQRQTAPWIDAALERVRTGAGGRGSRHTRLTAAALAAPKAAPTELSPHPYDPTDDDSDADDMYWKAVSAVRGASGALAAAETPSARRPAKRTRESHATASASASAAVWRAALAALAPDASSRATLALRWNALGLNPAAHTGLAGSGTPPLPPHVTAALAYVNAEGAGLALRRAIAARLAASPAPRGALAWRLVVAPFIPAEFEAPESRVARAAASKVPREFIWRRDAALREAAPVVAAAIAAARGRARNDRVLVPHVPRTPFVSPPTNIAKDVTIGDVTLRAHALPTLRLRVLVAEEDAEEDAEFGTG